MVSIQDVYSEIERCGVVPVVAIDSADLALGLADALAGGGLPVAEITFRTRAAADVMTRITAERPDMLVGAGTVLNVDDLNRARDCGAQFAVAPGFNPTVVEAALDIGLPFAPGVMTPTDVEAATSLGVTTLKFFPAGAAGGMAYLKSLSAPYKHLGVRFIPTGGVKAGNMMEYLSSDVVLAVGGTWVAKRDDINARNWAAITENCREVRELRGRR